MREVGIIRDIRDLKKVKKFLQYLNISFLSYAVPSLFGVAAAVIESVSTLLLIPISKALMFGNFDFFKGSKHFKNISEIIPGLFDSYIVGFILLLAAIFLCTLTKTTLQYMGRVIFAREARKFTDKLRKAIFDRYLSFGKLFFDRANIGHLNNILLGFTKTIGWNIVNLQGFVNSLVMLCFYVAIMMWVSWRVTALSLLLFPLFKFSIKFLIEKINKASLICADRENSLSEKAYNILSGIPIVKAYDTEEKERIGFAGLSDKVRETEFNIDKQQAMTAPLQEIISFIGIALLIMYIAFTMEKARLSELSKLIVFFYTFKKVVNNFGVFAEINTELARLKGPISKIYRIFNDEDKFFVINGNKKFNGLAQNITISDLNFSYHDERKALKGLNLVVEKGKITAIVGETGSGKTTLVNLLMRFYECPSGCIRLDGTDIRELDVVSYRARIALVSQVTLIFNDTIGNNIAYGLEKMPSDEEMLDVVTKARLYGFISSLPDGLKTYVGDRGAMLSGGEKQRIAIARALLKKTDILILDEATSSLDSITERMIQEAIEEIIKGKTVIVVAHRLSTIKNADKIAVMIKGSVVEEGSLKELLDKKGKFFRYWEEQKFF